MPEMEQTQGQGAQEAPDASEMCCDGEKTARAAPPRVERRKVLHRQVVSG
jgi:hypothetical protein